MNHKEEDNAPSKINNERLLIVVDVWKYIVSVQMHFNDMEMKVRNLYFTIVAASFGLIGVIQGKRIEFFAPNISVSLSIFVVLALVPISMLFYFMDRHWYHRLLQGSVNQCIIIEKKYADSLPEIQLGSQIGNASPVEFKGWIWKLAFFFVRDPRFRTGSKLHSDAKIEILYKTVIWASILLSVIFILMGGIRINGCAWLHFASDNACLTTRLTTGANGASPVSSSVGDKSKPATQAPANSSAHEGRYR